jgi:ADP-ribose pyrophosphatase
LEEQSGSSKWAYRGRTISVRVDPVHVGPLNTVREVVVRVPAVGVIAETASHDVVMIRQYRWAVAASLWELPAGEVDPGGSAAAAARRGLREETGDEARNWSLAKEIYPSPGYTDEKIYLYYATDLQKTEAEPEADEDIVTSLWSPERVRQVLQSATPFNGIAYAGLLWWLCRTAL